MFRRNCVHACDVDIKRTSCEINRLIITRHKALMQIQSASFFCHCYCYSNDNLVNVSSFMKFNASWFIRQSIMDMYLHFIFATKIKTSISSRVFNFFFFGQFTSHFNQPHKQKKKSNAVRSEDSNRVLSVVIQNYVKGKAVTLQAWTGPEGSRRLRLPYFKTISM